MAKVSYSANLGRHRLTDEQWQSLAKLLGEDVDRLSLLRIKVVSELYLMVAAIVAVSVPVERVSNQLHQLRGRAQNLYRELGGDSRFKKPKLAALKGRPDEAFMRLMNALNRLISSSSLVLKEMEAPNFAADKKVAWEFWIRLLKELFEQAGLKVTTSKHQEDRPSKFVQFVLAFERVLPPEYLVHQRTSLSSAIRKALNKGEAEVSLDRFLHPVVAKAFSSGHVKRTPKARAEINSKKLKLGPPKSEKL